MKNIKEISTTLSDSERKDKAEKFVLNMLAQLGMEDSDEESWIEFLSSFNITVVNVASSVNFNLKAIVF